MSNPGDPPPIRSHAEEWQSQDDVGPHMRMHESGSARRDSISGNRIDASNAHVKGSIVGGDNILHRKWQISTGGAFVTVVAVVALIVIASIVASKAGQRASDPAVPSPDPAVPSSSAPATNRQASAGPQTLPTWQPADVFTLGAAPTNPSPDKYGHSAVWQLAEGQGLDSATYRPLAKYTPAACGIQGDKAFSDPSGLPSISYNSTGLDLNTAGNCSSTFTIPRGALSVHPYSTDAIIQWTAPMDTTVAVTGQLSDADTNGGNGISWALGIRYPNAPSVATELASGSFDNGGSSNIADDSLSEVGAPKGAQLMLVVNAKGDPNFDLTNVLLRFDAAATSTAN